MMNESPRKSSAFSAGSVKKVRRHTWSDSQDHEEDTSGKEKKKQRHSSLGSPNAKTEANSGDLLGSIMSGMWNPASDGIKKEPEWEGQPNLREYHNRWMVQDPLKLDLTSSLSASIGSSSQMTSAFKKPASKSFGNNFKQKRIGNENDSMERQQLQAKARSFEIGKVNLVHYDGKKSKNKDPDYEPRSPNSKLKFSKEMKQDTKSSRSKSNWKGSDKLGSMRTSWRPNRAYDFNRNDMELNDPGTPNDEFNFVRT